MSNNRILSFGVFACLLLFLALSLPTNAQSNNFIKVNNSTKLFTDATGRTRIFHGVNAVYKIAPWHPELETFNTLTSLSAEDIKYLQEWGFTAIRLGVMWPGVSISSSQFNQTYLDTMLELVTKLGESGIYTIIDCHQDVFSRYYCGEGAPDWAVPNDPVTLEFPLPIANPSSMNFDPVTGYPNISSCLERGFFEYYFTASVGEAFQSLYDNKHQLQDHFIAYWQQVATTFKDSPYVLGYEIINEPWCGNIYHNPKALLDPGYADRTFLFPMYQNVTNAIREIDDQHIVFFESAVSDIYPCGFTEGPGGPAYDDRQAYSYHVYCAPTNDNGDPTLPRVCNLTELAIFDIKQSDWRRMGVAGFMTEFGALEGTVDGVESINLLMAKADVNFQSWTYWQYKYYEDITTVSSTGAESFWVNGTLDTAKVKALSRTHAQAIAGNPTVHTFDPDSGYFVLTYEVQSGLQSDVTQIYFNPDYYYPNGYELTYSEGMLNMNSTSPFLIQISNGNASGLVTIELMPKLN